MQRKLYTVREAVTDARKLAGALFEAGWRDPAQAVTAALAVGEPRKRFTGEVNAIYWRTLTAEIRAKRIEDDGLAARLEAALRARRV